MRLWMDCALSPTTPCRVGRDGGTKALHCIAWHGMALHSMAWHGIALHGMALHGTAWHCIPLHGMALHCIAWHCIALHCIALHVCHKCMFHDWRCHHHDDLLPSASPSVMQSAPAVQIQAHTTEHRSILPPLSAAHANKCSA